MATESLARPAPAAVGPQATDTDQPVGSQVFALGDKLLRLARGLAGALHGEKGTAAAVQGALQLAGTGMVTGIKNALDVRGHVRKHPWLAVGCAAAVGLLCAGLLRRA